MRDRFVSFFLFPLLGAIGFFLRTLQLRTGFEAGTGLPIPGAAVPTTAVICIILAAALLVSLRLPKPTGSPPSTPRTAMPRTALCLAAVLTAAMGILLLVRHDGSVNTLLAVSALFTAFFFLLPLHPGAGQGLHIFCPMEGALFYTAFLIVYFSRHLSDPAFPAFYPLLLALCAAAVSFCDLAGAACGRARPRRMAFALNAGCSLSLLAAADLCTVSGAPYACGLLAAAIVEYALSRRITSLSYTS